jgi:hypothetical protein
MGVQTLPPRPALLLDATSIHAELDRADLGSDRYWELIELLAIAPAAQRKKSALRNIAEEIMCGFILLLCLIAVMGIYIAILASVQLIVDLIL